MLSQSILASIVVGAAWAAPVKVAGVTASTTLPPAEGVTYDPKNLLDRKASTVWVEGDTAGSGLGGTIELDLGGEREVTELHLWNGNWYTWDFWTRHNRVKELEVIFSDGTEQTFTLTDEKKMEVVRLAAPKKTTSIKLRIRSIYRGSTFNDTVISEIIVVDSAPAEVSRPVSFSDSSHLPEDGDGDYVPSNALDQILDSMWCEGEKDGDGTGQWIEFGFGKPVALSNLWLVNGNAYDLGSWMKSNRSTELQLVFDGGRTETLAVKNSMTPQTLTFAPVTTSSVRVVFTAVARGKEYNDLCVSELAFGR